MKQIYRIIFKTLNKDFRHYLFKKTGYSLYKKRETSGKILEFIGTSGIGKTTIYRECVNELRKRWFFAYQLDSVKRRFSPCETDQILMRILRSRIEKIYDSDLFCPWHSLLDLNLSVRVMHDTMLVAGGEHPLGFVFDEGLFRHFPAEILQLGDEFPVHLWQNRAFVYVRARQRETVLSRYKQRRLIGSQKEVQRAGIDDQLLSQIVRDQEIFQSIVDRAVSLGCPVLVIDAESPTQDSIKQVLNFENSLISNLRKQ